MKTAVIGAGITGASVAAELARRGHTVHLFDQDQPASIHGSSHGRSRIVRLAYPDPLYTRIMSEGYPLWRELERESGEPLVNECGLLYFGLEASETLAAVEKGLREVGDVIEHWKPHAAGLDTLRLQEGEIGLYSPRAGWVHAERAVRATVRVAERNGASVEHRVADPLELSTRYDFVVLAPGAAITRWFPQKFEVRVQTLAYLEAQYNGPVYIEDGGEFFYGFPAALDESGVKVGIHNVGESWDMTHTRPGHDPGAVELMQSFVERRFGQPLPQVIENLTCLYTMTEDEDFRWGWMSDNVFWVSACSGHGFKFGPWIGRKCADFAEGREDPDQYPRFFRNWKPVQAYNG